VEDSARKFLASLTPWNDIYFRLSASDFKDERWQARHFAKQRVSDVQAALKYLEKHDSTKYNASSIATAKLATVVVGALAGKKARAKPSDFLPFDTSQTDKGAGPTDASLMVLRKLVSSRRLDGRLIGTLAEEIKQASSREQ
jgi:hypothetical protein